MHGYDVVFRCPSCKVSVTFGGTPNGDEAYAEEEATRILSRLCTCLGTSKLETQYVPTQWSYAPPGGKALA